MKKQPKFIKDFSKQNLPEERSKAAHEIWKKRSENITARKEASENEIKQNEMLESIKQLDERISDLSGNGLSKIRNYLQLRSLRSELSGKKSEYSTASVKEVISPDMEAPKKMLEDFYRDLGKKWEKTPYTKEDMEKNFSEEHLASLSLADYAQLMRRFPSEMVTHVTRQGIRDHTGMIWHKAGEGEYLDEFTKILEDGSLRSRLGIYLVQDEKEKAMAEFLHLDKVPKRELALERLEIFTRENQGSHDEGVGEYVDTSSIHFATEQVADHLYGGEKGNEIFFAFPSAQIASQYYFDGQLKESSGGWHNDQWVWANEEKGIDINSGLVFIPEGAKVDPETGSQYKLDKNKKPIANTKLSNQLQSLLEFNVFCQWAKENNAAHIASSGTEQEKRKLIESFEEQFISYSDEIKNFVMNSYVFMSKAENLVGVYEHKDKNGELAEDTRHRRADIVFRIKEALEEKGMLYKKAETTIPSKEYWEKYFAEHPGKRPSKIVYYQGISPTRALYEWQKRNDLKKTSDSMDLGFPERKVGREDPRAIAGMDRFKTLAEKVIDDYYNSKEEADSSHNKKSAYEEDQSARI